MVTAQELRSIVGATAYGPDGEKLGRVGQIYLDDDTGRPEWATIHTGLFGLNESFVPLRDATVVGADEVRFGYDKETVRQAPNVDPDGGVLSSADEARLYSHYGVSYGDSRDTAGLADRTDGRDRTEAEAGRHRAEAAGTEVGNSSGRGTDDAMTRSEERLRVGTTTEERGRARLRKYVVTENITETVPVTREKARIEREPITDANVGDALDGPDISADEHEVVLREERPVVEKETVPVERVRLTKDEVRDQETVGGEVRKERIEAEGDVDRKDRR